MDGKTTIDYDSLYVFGTSSYYHVKEFKLDPRAKKAFFMEILSDFKGFCLWCLETKKTIYSTDVTFGGYAMLQKLVEKIGETSKHMECEWKLIDSVEADFEGADGDSYEDVGSTLKPIDRASLSAGKIVKFHVLNNSN